MAGNETTIQYSLNPAFREFLQKRATEIEKLLPGLTFTDRQISYITRKLIEEFGIHNIIQINQGQSQ